VSAAIDSSLATDAQSSATAVCISKNEEQSQYLSSDKIMAHLHFSSPVVSPGNSNVTAHNHIAETGVQSSDKVDNMDEQDVSFETTVEYSICSDTQDSRITETCETQTTIDYYAESTTDLVIDMKNAVVDVRTETPVTSDIQKPVDMLSVPNSVSVDLRNNPTVCSPPTLVVV